MSIALLVALIAALLVTSYKWLRVAQREHYHPGRVTRMAVLWCTVRPINAVFLALIVAAAGVGVAYPPVALVCLLAVIWPWGLPISARTGKFRLTARTRRLMAVIAVVTAALAVLAAWGAHPERMAWVLVLIPVIVDVALALVQPWERAIGARYVRAATAKLARIAPVVVGITGSYGKTSTKLYVNHILQRYRATLPTPASFNNLMGLSSTINDRLMPGTDVFIAEMGTYGPGEIRELCAKFSPTIAAITTIGEAHLERMKTRATIVAAKSEIVEDAETAVLNVDVPELRELANRIAVDRVVIRCSAGGDGAGDADVCVTAAEGDMWVVTHRGQELARMRAPHSAHRGNLAIAVGIGLAAELTPDMIAKTLGELPTAPHRAEVDTVPGGPTVIDDTYNANPPGAFANLETARQLRHSDGQVFTITPGMIELGPEQHARNAALSSAATADDTMILVVVGRTNRAALVSGAQADSRVRLTRSRAEAVALVTQRAGPNDVILYENDLPDHYP